MHSLLATYEFAQEVEHCESAIDMICPSTAATNVMWPNLLPNVGGEGSLSAPTKLCEFRYIVLG